MICARLIAVDDTDDGEAAIAALDDGDAFADVAQQYSVDPAVVEADGWLTGDPANPCVPLTDLQFDAAPREHVRRRHAGGTGRAGGVRAPASET